MAKYGVNILSLILSCLIILPTQAQVTIDVARITCQQFLNFAITDPNNITLWMSGYYNGQRGDTIVDVQTLKVKNAKKVKDYCITNLNVSVMKAIEDVLGKGKPKQ